jgi:hypothetical protein
MNAPSFDQPFPLLRLFLRYIVPRLLILLVLSAILTAMGARQLAEGLNLEQAIRRAQIIDRAMAEKARDHCNRLKRGEAPALVLGSALCQDRYAARIALFENVA